MLCCPCFPSGKREKVRPETLQDAAIPRPPRNRHLLKRLRRLFKRAEKKTKESVTPQTDTLVVEGPIKDEVPSPECQPEVPATTVTSDARQDLTKEEEEEKRKGKESPVWSGRIGLQEEDMMVENLEGGEDTSSSQASVMETSSRTTSVSSLDRLLVQVMGQSGGRASRGRSRSPCSARTTPESPTALLHQFLQLQCRGLPNLGQTCYVNAVLQCLIHLQALCSQLLLQEAVWSIKPEALLLRTFVGLVRLRGSNDMDIKAAVVFEFKENIALHNQEFEGNSQNDAHEFLSECLLRLSAIGQELAMGDVAYQCPVDTLLSFQLRYIRTCQSCGVESSRDELSTMLSLDLVVQGSVEDSLQLYFAETAVEFQCDYCEGRDSSLRCSFNTLPQVLILHLKRFCPMTLTKRHQAVTLEPMLNLRALGERSEEAIRTPSPPARAVSSVDGETGPETTETSGQYKLISILSHIGSDATSGHYIADCQEQPGQWVSYDDDDVSITSEDAVLKDRERTAYILFYIKQ